MYFMNFNNKIINLDAISYIELYNSGCKVNFAYYYISLEPHETSKLLDMIDRFNKAELDKLNHSTENDI